MYSAVPNELKLKLNSMSCLVIKARLSKSELELKQIINTCQERMKQHTENPDLLTKYYKVWIYRFEIAETGSRRFKIFGDLNVSHI